jgi:UDP-N-acetylglucosamine--N-acetylmuramyl-(pentapeptide) pyrophosphoryl-undecaprenol N-acetylglucosamine transferase
VNAVFKRPTFPRVENATTAPIVIAAGGTGGHFFPAEALALELAERGHRIALMCDARSGGLRSVVFGSGDRYILAGAGVAGRGAVRAMRGGIGIAAGTIQATRILARAGAAAVVAFGGYPSVAPVLGARLLGRRRPAVILHEQNAVLGRANRLLSRYADAIALSHVATTHLPAGRRFVVTGNPVRPAIASWSLREYAMPLDVIELLVLGGSLGARVLSDVVPAAIAMLPEALRARIRMTQQCRAEDIARVGRAYVEAGVPAETETFFADVDERLSRAHLVIARAGASTVAELAVIGRPSILVPLPGAIDDHQTANARALADAGGAWLMPQPQFDAPALAAKLLEVLENPTRLAVAAERSASLGHTDATRALADLVEETITIGHGDDARELGA